MIIPNINAFSGKTDPVDNDILMIEDSENSFEKKKLTVNNLLKNTSESKTIYVQPDTDPMFTIPEYYRYVISRQDDVDITLTLPVSEGKGRLLTVSHVASDSFTGLTNASRLWTFSPPMSGYVVLDKDGTTSGTSQWKYEFTVVEKTYGTWQVVSGDVIPYF